MNFPPSIATVNQMAPVPRRIRATLDGRVVIDTTRAVYLWEWPHYPQYYIPLDDIVPGVLVDEAHEQRLSRGRTRRFGLRAGDVVRPKAARLYTADSLPGLAGLVRFEWEALDAWFEEDEEVLVHPRNPYTRVDAMRSNRRFRVELDGMVLADSASPVMLFETGLPTRYYLDRTAVNFAALERTDTMTPCPYKGRTSDYWSVRTPVDTYRDLAWSYSYPTPAVSAIAGLVSFYNEKVDMFLDDRPLERPVTHFFK
ncbi:DUF427 domain-containing protein [Actinoplanes sp. NPDC049596]|uniref:DUF427 domain-containing protein n=1 Tax=unclassified Actinoplanes TaxID=2626549 RepID=UPI0034476F10